MSGKQIITGIGIIALIAVAAWLVLPYVGAVAGISIPLPSSVYNGHVGTDGAYNPNTGLPISSYLATNLNSGVVLAKNSTILQYSLSYCQVYTQPNGINAWICNSGTAFIVYSGTAAGTAYANAANNASYANATQNVNQYQIYASDAYANFQAGLYTNYQADEGSVASYQALQSIISAASAYNININQPAQQQPTNTGATTAPTTSIVTAQLPTTTVSTGSAPATTTVVSPANPQQPTTTNIFQQIIDDILAFFQNLGL